MSVTFSVNYKETFKPEVVSLIDDLVEDNYALDDILEFIDENGEDNFQTYYVEYCEQGENLGYDVVDAFVKENGFCDVEHCGDAFVGVYTDGADFAEKLLDETGESVPDWVVVDWNDTWNRSLCYDYDAVEIGFREVYIFRKYY